MFQRRRSRRKLRSGMSETIPEALQCDQISQVKIGFRLYIHHDLDPLNSSKMPNYIYTILYMKRYRKKYSIQHFEGVFAVMWVRFLRVQELCNTRLHPRGVWRRRQHPSSFEKQSIIV